MNQARGKVVPALLRYWRGVMRIPPNLNAEIAII